MVSNSGSNTVAFSTPAASWVVWVNDQIIACVWVSFRAVCFSATKSGRSDATQNVYPARYKFEMDRVATRAIAAKVINLPALFTVRQWVNKPSVHQAVGMDNCIVKTGSAVAARDCRRPYPARRAVELNSQINFDLGENTDQVFGGKMVNGKVSLRHFSLLYRLICLEPLRRVSVFGRLGYFSIPRIIPFIKISGDVRSDANY